MIGPPSWNGETKRSFKEIVNATLRRGLEHEQNLPLRQPVVTRLHAFDFKAGVDPTMDEGIASVKKITLLESTPLKAYGV